MVKENLKFGYEIATFLLNTYTGLSATVSTVIMVTYSFDGFLRP